MAHTNNKLKGKDMKNRNTKEPSPWFILTVIVLIFIAVIAFDANAKQETPDDIRKNEIMIAKISDCKMLALNSGLTEQVKAYNAELRKFDDFYQELKVYYAGRSLGFLGGVLYQAGFTRPKRKQARKMALKLYAKQCGMYF